MARSRRVQILTAILLAFAVAPARAQLAPEIGYMLPPGGQAGASVDVVLGGFDWTPDMQVFVHDPRIKLEITGPPSGVLITEPPYWFGYKARGYAWPLAREFPARLTIPADVAPGLIRWQVANANGASPPGFLHVGSAPEINEDQKRKSPQVLPSLPVTVNGQIRRIEEIDQYQFKVSKSGPVTIELMARRIGSPLYGMIKVRDPSGHVVLDAAGTEGRDLCVTMRAEADVLYELSLNDHDFAGDRSYVYRLALSAAPQVLAAYPAAGKRGETRPVEFVGHGLATGGDQIESVTRNVVFPAAPDVTTFNYAVETEWGNSKPVQLLVSDQPESTKQPTGESTLAAPGAVTGWMDQRFGSDRYTVQLSKGQSWLVSAQARAIGAPLDVELTVNGPDGKQVATNDDAPGTTDSELVLNVPVDGAYQIIVTDRSGKSGTRVANYHLSLSPVKEDVEVTIPSQLAIPIGTTAKVPLKVVRKGGFKAPIPIVLTGLPEGVTVPADITVPENKSELEINLTSSADAACTASLSTVSITPQINGVAVSKSVGTILIATTLKPRFKLTPEGLDDVRKVHRGSTYLFPMLIERLEGFDGPITLEMTAKQQRHRQGLASDEFVVPADAKRVEYPIFVPEWMETTKTSRMILNGSAKVADPKGNIRTVLQRQELRFGILPEGALMKLTHGAPVIRDGQIQVPLELSLASELKDPIELSFVPEESQQSVFAMKPISLVAGQKGATVAVTVAPESSLSGEHELHFRASTLKDGWPVISETTVVVEMPPRR